MKKPKISKIFAGLMALSGLALLAAAIYPIASYEAMSKQRYPVLLDPVVEDQQQVKSQPIDNAKSSLEANDYTKASNWFVGGANKADFNESKVSYYNISIPKLKIEDAVVAIGGDDLSKHLIQYPGTALPGKKGNAVIFGHSILPAFYNPKSYMSIFSLLPTLESGDMIKVDFDGIEYRYIVEDLFEVHPTDIQVLQQDITDSFLTLVTCTPPGDPRKPRRLIVRARISSPQAKKYANPRS